MRSSRVGGGGGIGASISDRGAGGPRSPLARRLLFPPSGVHRARVETAMNGEKRITAAERPLAKRKRSRRRPTPQADSPSPAEEPAVHSDPDLATPDAAPEPRREWPADYEEVRPKR